MSSFCGESELLLLIPSYPEMAGFTNCVGRRRRSKLELTIPERASAAAASLQGRLRENNRRGGGGRKARNTRSRERNLSITIPRSQSILCERRGTGTSSTLSAGEGAAVWAEG
jgi:hypothetical protein